MKVAFVCPGCRASLRARADKAGASVACPVCKGTVQVPDAAGEGTQPAGGPDWTSLLSPAQGEGELGRLGDYRVLAVLDTRGMGVVFRAFDPALGREVALKVMLPGLATPALRQRF